MDAVAAMVAAGEPAYGLLLGGRRHSESGQSILVEHVEPVLPSTRIDARLAALESEGVLAVGVFRAGALASMRRDWLHSHNPTAPSLILSVRNLPDVGMLATLECLNGQPSPLRSDPQPFPFSEPDPILVQKKARVPQPDHVLWAANAALAVVLLIFGLALWRDRPAVPPPPPAFDLFAERSGAHWSLTWNSGIPTLLNARTVSVVVHDGMRRTTVPLTANQVRSGSYLYPASNPDAAFSLEVSDREGRTARETLVVVAQPKIRRAASR